MSLEGFPFWSHAASPGGFGSPVGCLPVLCGHLRCPSIAQMSLDICVWANELSPVYQNLNCLFSKVWPFKDITKRFLLKSQIFCPRGSGWGREPSQLGQVEPLLLFWMGQKGHFKLQAVTMSSKPVVTLRQGALFLVPFWTLQMCSDLVNGRAHRDHSRNELATMSAPLPWWNRNLVLCCRGYFT